MLGVRNTSERFEKLLLKTIGGEMRIQDVAHGVVLSIKPKYIESIYTGKKKWEFRKKIPVRSVGTVYLYVSQPRKQIAAKFEFGTVLSGNPESIWKLCEKESGITQAEFKEYFASNSHAFAVGIRNLKWYRIPIDPFKIIPDFKPPQNFRYLKKRERYDG